MLKERKRAVNGEGGGGQKGGEIVLGFRFAHDFLH